jgi:hypothetical protein
MHKIENLVTSYRFLSEIHWCQDGRCTQALDVATNYSTLNKFLHIFGLKNVKLTTALGPSKTSRKFKLTASWIDTEFWVLKIIKESYIKQWYLLNAGLNHGISNYLDFKAKCLQVKKCTCKGTLRQVFICLRLPPLPLLWPHTSPLTHCIHLYCKVMHTEKGAGGRSNQREGLRGATVHKAGSKIPS